MCTRMPEDLTILSARALFPQNPFRCEAQRRSATSCHVPRPAVRHQSIAPQHKNTRPLTSPRACCSRLIERHAAVPVRRSIRPGGGQSGRRFRSPRSPRPSLHFAAIGAPKSRQGVHHAPGVLREASQESRSPGRGAPIAAERMRADDQKSTHPRARAPRACRDRALSGAGGSPRAERLPVPVHLPRILRAARRSWPRHPASAAEPWPPAPRASCR